MKGFKCFSMMLLVMIFTLNFAQAAPDIGNYAKIHLAPLPVSNPFTAKVSQDHFKGCFSDNLTSYSIINYNDVISQVLILYINPHGGNTLYGQSYKEFNTTVNNPFKIWVIPLQVNKQFYSYTEIDRIVERIKYRSKL